MSDTPTAQPDVNLQVLLGQRLPPDPPAPLATARAVIAFAAQLRIHELLDIPLRALHLHGGSSAWLHRFGMDWNLGDLLSARRGDLTIMRVATPPWQLVSAALAWITGVVRLRAAEAATLAERGMTPNEFALSPLNSSKGAAAAAPPPPTRPP